MIVNITQQDISNRQVISLGVIVAKINVRPTYWSMINEDIRYDISPTL